MAAAPVGEVELVRRYLAPPRRGLEIGASAINPFPGIDALNLDYPGGDLFQAAQERVVGSAVPVDIYGMGDDLPFRDGSLDFVLSSHVLEHMPDTIRCLREWSRVVVDGGVVFMIVPHRERTFDATRPRTELLHHYADYALGMDIDATPLVPPSHYHVWITEDVVNLVEDLNSKGMLDWEILAVEDVDTKVGNGFTLVARKNSHRSLPISEGASDTVFYFATLDLPFQVVMRTTEHVVHGAQLEMPRDLPRGRYRVTPVLEGFPPQALPPQLVEVGEPVLAPNVTDVQLDGTKLRFLGEALTPTTYLEADFGAGVVHRVLPEFVDGVLEFDTTGQTLPPAPIPMVAVNLPPGGGRGVGFELRAHLD